MDAEARKEARRQGSIKGAATLHRRYAHMTKEWGARGSKTTKEKYWAELSEWGRRGNEGQRRIHADKIAEWTKKGMDKCHAMSDQERQKRAAVNSILRGLGK